MGKFNFNNPELQKICNDSSQVVQDQHYRLELVNNDIKNLNAFCDQFIGSREPFKCEEDLFLIYSGERICVLTSPDQTDMSFHLSSAKAVTRLKLQKYFSSFLKFYIDGGI